MCKVSQDDSYCQEDLCTFSLHDLKLTIVDQRKPFKLRRCSEQSFSTELQLIILLNMFSVNSKNCQKKSLRTAGFSNPKVLFAFAIVLHHFLLEKKVKIQIQAS